MFWAKSQKLAYVPLSKVAIPTGFRLDNRLNMKKQISTHKSACFGKLTNISRIRYYLNNQQIKTHVQATVILSLDYCNALYFGCASNALSQLQLIQNRACMVIFGLKIEERVKFKILLLTYKSLNGLAPSYICNILTIINITSNRNHLLHIPPSNSDSSHPFQIAASKLWNSLPINIRNSETVEILKNN